MNDVAKIEDAQWYAAVPRSIWKQTTAGLLLMVVTLGGFGTWALTAPLAAAIIAQGSFVATGQNKIIQHLEGGIVQEVLVREGQRVEANQPLLRLDPTASEARLNRLLLRRHRLIIMRARLEAEARGDATFTLPTESWSAHEAKEIT